jgi:glycosyltransferase involved in cell wall biosynthesis
MGETLTNSPDITVLLPVYNGERYLAQAIQSILDQTFEDFELLIIDDGSTDRAPEIIKQFSDPRIRAFNNKKNIGLIGTLNKGIGLANGRYIARMDQDDWSVPDRLTKQWSFMEKHQDVGVCGSWIKAIRVSEEQLWEYPKTNADIRCRMLFYCAFAHPSVMIRRAMLTENNVEYDAGYIHAEDYELWSRCMDYCNLANLPVPLLNYRIHESNTTSLHADEQKQTGKRVQKNMLKLLGVEASRDELDLHFDIGRGGLRAKLDDLDRVDAWFSRLAEANQVSRYFPEPEFQNTLALYWLNACKSMQSLGPIVARRFSKSKHAKGLSSPHREEAERIFSSNFRRLVRMWLNRGTHLFRAYFLKR